MVAAQEEEAEAEAAPDSPPVLPFAVVGGGATEVPFRLPMPAFTALKRARQKKKSREHPLQTAFDATLNPKP